MSSCMALNVLRRGRIRSSVRNGILEILRVPGSPAEMSVSVLPTVAAVRCNPDELCLLACGACQRPGKSKAKKTKQTKKFG